MSVALGKIPGIHRVNVSLNKALVSMELKPGNSATLDQIRKAILNDAFTPEDATVSVIGKLVWINGKPAFQVSGTNQLYEIGPAPKAAQALGELVQQRGKMLLVHGVIPAPPKGGKGAPRLLVKKFRNASEESVSATKVSAP